MQEPFVGESTSPIILRSVDLPAPFDPVMAMISDGRASNETGRKMGLEENRLVRSVARIVSGATVLTNVSLALFGGVRVRQILLVAEAVVRGELELLRIGASHLPTPERPPAPQRRDQCHRLRRT